MKDVWIFESIHTPQPQLDKVQRVGECKTSYVWVSSSNPVLSPSACHFIARVLLGLLWPTIICAEKKLKPHLRYKDAANLL